MRKLFALAFALTSLGFFTSCDDDDKPSDKELQQEAFDLVAASVAGTVSTDASATGIDEDDTNFDWTYTKGSFKTAPSLDRVVVKGVITSDTTFTADKIWELQNRVVIASGATLTIEAGTWIEGATSVDGTVLEGTDASVLMIAAGAKIMAEGTATEPIIMTATEPGTGAATVKGKWGGLVVLGNAPISAETSPAQIEGVPADDTNGLYGGSTAADNSGVITYVSIRHGGAVIDAAAGDEINGLTLGGVGSGTTIDHVEVYANSDDGIEFFGGTVDVDYPLVAQVGDDALDVDQSYVGTITNYLVYVDEDTDEGLEIDGREGSAEGAFTLTNGTIIAVSGSITCDFKSKAQATVTNLNANGGKIKLDASFDEETFLSEENAAQNVIDGTLKFSKVNATFEVYTDDLPALEEE